MADRWGYILQDDKYENRPFYHDASTSNFGSVNIMQTGCVSSNSLVISTPSTTFQTPSMLANNYDDRIDRVGSGNYFEVSHAINISKPKDTSHTCPHVHNTRNR
jgi:hypothetical protein